MSHHLTWRIALLAVAVVLIVGCSKHKVSVDGYRVVSYDGRTAEWVVVRTGTYDGEHQTKRMTLQCDFYKWDDHEAVSGPKSCDLRIGRLMVDNSYEFFSGKSKDHFQIDEMSSDLIAFTKGTGDKRVAQHFMILHQEMLPESSSK